MPPLRKIRSARATVPKVNRLAMTVPSAGTDEDGIFIRKRNVFAAPAGAVYVGTIPVHDPLVRVGSGLEHRNDESAAKFGVPANSIGKPPDSPDAKAVAVFPSSQGQYATGAMVPVRRT
jgi:hypothetical protein